ncbi:MAG: hypothetical protein Q4B23_03540 [Helcococcus sp.]|nr:hypothetical protein [Helcococcus sp.]
MKGTEVNNTRIRKKRRRNLFIRMYPTLKIISILLGGLAFVGWTLMGTWFLYFLMK